MRSGQKSKLVQLLEASTTADCPDVDVKDNVNISQLCHQTSTECKHFLQADENKSEVFQYLAESVTAIQFTGVEVISKSGFDAVSPFQ